MAEKKDLNLDFFPDYSSVNDSRSDLFPSQFRKNENVLSEDMESGRTSPVRARTMKEYDQQIADLQKENFNLKLRIYFLEENARKYHNGEDQDIYQINIELKVEMESLRKDLMDKQELLKKASTALESVMENQEKMKFSELEKLENELSTTKHQLDQLTNENERMKERNERLKFENERLNELNKEINGLYESLRRQFDQLQLEKNDTNTTLDNKNHGNDHNNIDDGDDGGGDDVNKKNINHHDGDEEKENGDNKRRSSSSSSQPPPLERQPSSSLLVVISGGGCGDDGGGGGGGDEDLGSRKSRCNEELKLKDKLIEQLRCALKVKDIIIEQMEVENNEVKAKFRGQINGGVIENAGDYNDDLYDDDDEEEEEEDGGGGGGVVRSSWSNLYHPDGGDNDDGDGGGKVEDEIHDEGEGHFDSSQYRSERVMSDMSYLQIRNLNEILNPQGNGNGKDEGDEENEEENRMEKLRRENEDLKERIWVMEMNFGEWRDVEKRGFVENAEALKRELKKLLIQKDDMEAQFFDLQVKLDHVQERCHDFNCENADLKEKVTFLESILAAKNEEGNRLVDRLKENEDTLSDLKSELMKRNDYSHIVDRKNEELRELEDKIKNITDENATLSLKLNNVEDHVKVLEANLSEKLATETSLIEKLSIGDELGQQLNCLLKEGSQINKELSQRIESLTKKSEDSIHQKDKIIDGLNARVDELKRENDALKRNLEDKEEKLRGFCSTLKDEGKESFKNNIQSLEVGRSDWTTDNRVIETMVEKSDLIGQWSDLVSDMEKDWLMEAKDFKAWKEKLHMLTLQNECLACEKETMALKFTNEMKDKNSEIESLKKEITEFKKFIDVDSQEHKSIDAGTKEKKIEKIFGKLGPSPTQLITLQNSNVQKPENTSNYEIDTSPTSPANKVCNFTDEMHSNSTKNNSKINYYGGDQMTPDVSPPFCIMTSEDCKPFADNKRDVSATKITKPSDFFVSMTTALKNVLPADGVKLAKMTKDQVLEWVQEKRNEMMCLMKNSDVLKFISYREEGDDVSDVRSGAKNSKFYLNYPSMSNNNSDSISNSQPPMKTDERMESLTKELNSVKSELVNANQLVDLLTEQIKLNNDNDNNNSSSPGDVNSKKSKSKNNFNPELIVKLVAEIKILKQKLATAVSSSSSSKPSINASADDITNENSITNRENSMSKNEDKLGLNKSSDVQHPQPHLHFKRWTNSNDSAICPSNECESRSLSTSSTTNQKKDSSTNVDQLKLTEYHKQLRLSNISAYDNNIIKNNSGRISDLHKKGHDLSLTSSTKVNFTPRLEQSFRDLDSELGRLSLIPDMDSTRLDYTNDVDNNGASRKISGDSQLLADMLAVSENRCRLMRDRLEEIVVFLKKLLDNPNISSSLLGMSGDVSKMSQCLNETASLLEDVSVWMEEGQDFLNQTSGCSLGGGGVNSSFNVNNRSSIIGRHSLIGRSSLLGVVKERHDENEDGDAPMEKDNLQRERVESESETNLKQYQVEISKLKEQISLLNNETADVTNKYEQLKLEASTSKQSADTLSNTLIGCQGRIKEVESEINSLKLERESLISAKEQLEKEKNELLEARKLDNAVKNDQFAKLKMVLVELSTKLQQNENEIENYHRQIKSISNENIDLKEKLKSLDCLVEQLKEERDYIQDRSIVMEGQLNEVIRKLNNAYEEMEVITKSQIACQHDKVKTLEELEMFKSECKFMEENFKVEKSCLVRSFESDNKLQTDLIQQLKGEISELNERLKSTIIEKQELDTKLMNMDEEKAALSVACDDLKKELKSYEIKISESKTNQQVKIAMDGDDGTKFPIENYQLNKNSDGHYINEDRDRICNVSPVGKENIQSFNITTTTPTTQQQQVVVKPLSEQQRQHNNSSKYCNISYHSNLEMEMCLLKEERDSLSRKLFEISKKNSFLNSEQLGNNSDGTSKVPSELPQPCDHTSFLKEIERLKRHYSELKTKHSKCPSSTAAAAATGKPPKDAEKMIRGKISQSEVIEQINKTRKILAQTTMNLDLVHHTEKLTPSKGSDPIG